MLQRLAKALIWPVRRFFDPRFAGVDDHVGIVHRELDENLADLRATEIAALREQLATRSAPEDLERALAPIRDELQTLRQTIEESRDSHALLLRESSDQAGDAAAVLGQSIAELRAELDELARTVERLSG
jgi:phage shock protein A